MKHKEIITILKQAENVAYNEGFTKDEQNLLKVINHLEAKNKKPKTTTATTTGYKDEGAYALYYTCKNCGCPEIQAGISNTRHVPQLNGLKRSG